jgi:quercetin dioxygenase-like cupin family protein
MNSSDDDQQSERLRQAPTERFAGTTHAFDLATILEQLRSEAHPSKDGHRQMTILHQPPVGHVLFAFEAGGHLNRHVTRGAVTIHVLEGHLSVEAEGHDHELEAGHLLALGPGVPHDVRAPVRAAMLLTVHMIEPAPST